jgi:C4-dicarboxylate-specific signal transduction histidine kinase
MSVALADYKERTESQVVGLRRANEALFEAQDELVRVERLAAVGRMAAGVAHEIGNPLAAVIGYNQLLIDDHTKQSEVADMLERSKSELGRIRDILKELMDSAAPESTSKARVDLRDLLQSVTERARTHPRTQNHPVSVVIPDEPVEVLASANRLHQVMLNLILNAADASGEEGSVTIECRVVDTAVEIECRDNGAGFTAEALERGTEPFFTTKSVGKGRGLGLSTSYGFVKGLGGTISLSNKPDGGGCVVLSLPRLCPEGVGE